MSSTVPHSSTSGSRSRPQARKKPNDEASYSGPSGGATVASGTKRHAVDRIEGELTRGKRKRVDALNTAVSHNRREIFEPESRTSLVEFVKMPTPVLYRYLTQYDIIPYVYPSPLSADDPPPPFSLENFFHHPTRTLSPPPMTPANRPHRELKEQNRRRSTRLHEEEIRSRSSIHADIEELHVVLAGIVERHFREISLISGREEVDTLASFMCAVEKAKGVRVKC